MEARLPYRAALSWAKLQGLHSSVALAKSRRLRMASRPGAMAPPAVATTRDLLLLEKHCYVFVQQRTPPFHGRPRATPADGNRRLLSPAEWAASRDVPRQPSA